MKSIRGRMVPIMLGLCYELWVGEALVARLPFEIIP